MQPKIKTFLYDIQQACKSSKAFTAEVRQIIGFRNVLVHGYFAVEDETVWGIVMNEVAVLEKETCRLLEESK